MQESPGLPKSWMIRTYPGRALRTAAETRKAEQNLLPLLRQLTGCAAPFESVNTIDDLLMREKEIESVSEGYAFTEEDRARPLYIKERDRQAFCLILPPPRKWRRDAGINIIVTHIDSPLMRVREQPTYFEWDPEKRFNHPGPYLELRAYGGVNAADFEGQTGHIQGKIVTRGREIMVRVPARIPATSIHLEPADEKQENSFNRIHAYTGATSVVELHKQLRIKNEKDLFAAELYFMPDTRFLKFGSDFISAFGLDDKACVSAALHAATSAKPARPSFIFGLCAEEIGSVGTAGKTTGFFKRIVNKYMSFLLESPHLLNTEQLYDMNVLGRYPAICGDVCPTPSINEMEEMNNTITTIEIPRLGFGPFVSTSWGGDGNHIAPRYASLLKEALDCRLKNGIRQKYQVVGSEFKGERSEQSYTSHFARHFTDDHVPMLAMGVPVQDLHRPNGEMMFMWDWVQTIEAYRAYLEHVPRRIDPPERRRRSR